MKGFIGRFKSCWTKIKEYCQTNKAILFLICGYEECKTFVLNNVTFLSFFFALLCVGLACLLKPDFSTQDCDLIGKCDKGIDSLKEYSEIVRNFLVALAAIFALPFAVWRNITSDKTAKTAQKSQDNETYAKSVEQLASKYESVRLGAVLTFKEIVKNSNDASLIQKTCDMLYCFMEEHSRQGMKILSNVTEFIDYNTLYNKSEKDHDEYLEQEYSKAYKATHKYYSQFYEILVVLALVKMKKIQVIKLPQSMKDICLVKVPWHNKNLFFFQLHQANLQNANLSKAILANVNLSSANLYKANLYKTKVYNQGVLESGDSNLQSHVCLNNAYLSESYISKISLKNSCLMNADLEGAVLESVDLTSCTLNSANLVNTDLERVNSSMERLEKTNFQHARYNTRQFIDEHTRGWEPTKFPEGFDPKAHGMIDVCD